MYQPKWLLQWQWRLQESWMRLEGGRVLLGQHRFLAEGSRLDKRSSCSFRRSLWRCRYTWRKPGSASEWDWVEGLSLQLRNMTSLPTFLTPTCSRFTWICWRVTNNVSREVSQSSLDTCLWWLWLPWESWMLSPLFFVDTWSPILCTVLDFIHFHFTSPKNLKLHETSLHEKNNETIYFTKTSLHLV